MERLLAPLRPRLDRTAETRQPSSRYSCRWRTWVSSSYPSATLTKRSFKVMGRRTDRHRRPDKIALSPRRMNVKLHDIRVRVLRKSRQLSKPQGDRSGIGSPDHP